jgi:hypothetical protein
MVAAAPEARRAQVLVHEVGEEAPRPRQDRNAPRPEQRGAVMETACPAVLALPIPAPPAVERSGGSNAATAPSAVLYHVSPQANETRASKVARAPRPSAARRFYWGPGAEFWFYDGYYHGDCRWLRRKAVQTGRQYWWRRYRLCRGL